MRVVTPVAPQPLCAGNWEAVPVVPATAETVSYHKKVRIILKHLNEHPLCKAGLSRRLRPLCAFVRDVTPVLLPLSAYIFVLYTIRYK